jgi:hypothetical protein
MAAQDRSTITFNPAQDGIRWARGELIALVDRMLRHVDPCLIRRRLTDHSVSPTTPIHDGLSRLAALHNRKSQFMYDRLSVPVVTATHWISSVSLA